MKVRSGQIYSEHFDYQLDTTVQQFWFSKGRPGGVLELVDICLYNASAGSITVYYILFRHNGVVSRLFYNATVTTKKVQALPITLYLDDGDELGVEMDGAANGDKFEIFAQFIHHKDGDE